MFLMIILMLIILRMAIEVYDLFSYIIFVFIELFFICKE